MNITRLQPGGSGPVVFPSVTNQSDSCASAEVTDTAGGEVSSREKTEKKILNI